MSMDVSGTGAGSATHQVSIARLLTTYVDIPEEHHPASSVLAGRSSHTVDAGVNFSRSVRRALHEHFQNVFMQLTPRMKAKDIQLYTHSQRVLTLVLRLLRVLDLAQDEVVAIALAAYFHDIGKLYLDDALLNKAAPLTADEYEMIQQHSAFGVDLLSPYVPSQVAALSFVHHHHERWDGRGYPCGLEGEAIPLGARAIAIVDAFDAMTSERVYQAQRTPYEALEELMRCAGTQFDPRLVRLFLIVR
jgi:HD-GYP domain-containing protein (c-di-GMP phosphodiesterase class II)